MAQTPQLIFIGPVPPPVHGQAVCTAAILRQVQERNVSVLSVNTSEGNQGYWKRIKAHASAFHIIRSSSAHAVYISVNARWGMFLTLLLTAVARNKGMHIILHHHFYGYVAKASKIMQKLVDVAGVNALHVTNCKAMCLEMQTTYPRLKKLIGYSNIGVVSAELKPNFSGPQDQDVEISLGHLSNLTQSKGIGTVISAFRELSNEYSNLKLHIAGPCHDDFASKALASIREEMGDRVVYHNAVYGEDKQRFFDSIDIFVYPTKVDTQGIVNLEALACGKPVIATAFCCIPGDIGEDGGVAVPDSDDFTVSLRAYLDYYRLNSRTAGERARARFDALLDEHKNEQAVLFAALCGVDDHVRDSSPDGA